MQIRLEMTKIMQMKATNSFFFALIELKIVLLWFNFVSAYKQWSMTECLS